MFPGFTDYLNSPIPLIIGGDTDSNTFRHSFATKQNKDLNFVIYYSIEDKIEFLKKDIYLPSFDGKIAKIEKRYRNLQKYYLSGNFLLKNKDAYLMNFLSKFRASLDNFLIEPIMLHQLYTESLQDILQTIIQKNPQDSQFLTNFGSTQIFASYIEKLKIILKASGGSLGEYEDLV